MRSLLPVLYYYRLKKLQTCVVGSTIVKYGTCLLEWFWFYSCLFFLWLILLPVEDSRRKRTSIDHPAPSSHGVSCFLLEIAIVRGPRLTTSSPTSYGLSCFLFELTKGMAKIPPPIAKIPSPPFAKIPLSLSPKYHPPISEIPPSYRQNTTPPIAKIPPPYLDTFSNTHPMNMFHVKTKKKYKKIDCI